MHRIIFRLFIVFASWFIVHVTIITADGLTDNAEKADCLLVLGNTVNKDGSLSARLKSRMDKSFMLYQQGLAPTIIVSGGLGKEGYFEGSAMKNYLITLGVPEGAIIVDNDGNNTNATAQNFAALAEENKFRSVIVVSQFFHLTRTKYTIRKKGIQNVYGAHAEYFEWRDLYSVFREFVAFYKYAFLH